MSFVDANSSFTSEVSQRYPDVRAFPDLDATMASDVTAAVIATPAPLHLPLATQLADAGIHVLIEKPLAVDLDGLEAFKDIVRLRNVVAGVAYVYRLHPALVSMRAAIISGQLGRPVELVAVAGQHFPTYRPSYRETYYSSHGSGGGAIQDALTHIINASEWLVGPVSRLVADADRLILDGVEVEDTVHVIARHGDVLASYSLNQHQSPNETTITVICDRGAARFEFHASRWRMMLHPGDDWIENIHALESDELFTRQANAFLDSIERHDSTPCTLDEGTATLRVNRAILQSVHDGLWQTLS
ncbi:MAG: Gfo/Idh/MocA family oxidoreductase [Pirellulales bacterium]|nr:Gfo/Idh/MocA family oxidoreductase [Pirellulales bacterium]